MPSAKELITPEVIERVIQTESGHNPHAVSPTGARGLMQLMPAAWRDVQNRVKDLAPFGYDQYAMDEQTNRRFGTEYLKLVQSYLPEESQGSLPHVLAAYNGGPGRLKSVGYDLRKMPRETQQYIHRVTGAPSGRAR